VKLGFWLAIGVMALLIIVGAMMTANYQSEIERLQQELSDQQVSSEQARLEELQAVIAHYDSWSLSNWIYLPWQSTQELSQWLEENDINEREYIPACYDCDDFALDLFWAGLDDNRLLPLLVVKGDGHIMNFAIVGNYVYSVEPQSDAIKKIGVID
jgi:hypothetical protein